MVQRAAKMLAESARGAAVLRAPTVCASELHLQSSYLVVSGFLLAVVEQTIVGVDSAVPSTRTPVPQQWSDGHFTVLAEQSSPYLIS